MIPMSSSIKFIDPNTLRNWTLNNQAVIYDVREPNEYKTLHIPGAILVPLSNFDPTVISAETEKNIVIHCASGIRCGVAAQKLLKSGFSRQIYRLSGGIDAWSKSGFSIVRD